MALPNEKALKPKISNSIYFHFDFNRLCGEQPNRVRLKKHLYPCIFIDQSKSEYNITLPGGVAPGHQLDRQLRGTLEQIEREKRARQRASMTHE